MKRVRLGREAEHDLAGAIAWLEEENPAAAVRFAQRVRAALEFIEQFPLSGARVPGAKNLRSRRVRVQGFRYHLVFVDVGPYIEVIAVAHDRRRPAYWER